LNEEFLVNACHQQALNTSLFFVHTARRCYRLNGSMSSKEFLCCSNAGRVRITSNCII